MIGYQEILWPCQCQYILHTATEDKFNATPCLLFFLRPVQVKMVTKHSEIPMHALHQTPLSHRPWRFPSIAYETVRCFSAKKPPVCIPPHLSEVSQVLPLKQFWCLPGEQLLFVSVPHLKPLHALRPSFRHFPVLPLKQFQSSSGEQLQFVSVPKLKPSYALRPIFQMFSQCCHWNSSRVY